MFSILLGIIPSDFNMRNRQFSKVVTLFYNLTSNAWGFQFLIIITNTCYYIFSIIIILMDMQCYLTVGMIYII